MDPDTHQPMDRGFETRICKHSLQANFEAPVAADTFALTDASQFFACLATAENFGCVLHEESHFNILVPEHYIELDSSKKLA